MDLRVNPPCVDNSENRAIDALIKIAEEGYGNELLDKTNICRAIRGEEQIWDSIINLSNLKTKRTRLMYASKVGDINNVKWLIKRNANPFLIDFYNKTALFYACQYGHLDIVNILIDYMKYKSFKLQNKNILLELIKLPSEQYWTMLEYVCLNCHYKNFIEIAKILILEGADPFVESFNGFSPLVRACRAGNVELVQLFLNTCKNFKLKKEISTVLLVQKVSAIHVSAEGGHYEIAKILLENGANPNEEIICNLDGLLYTTPLILASKNGHLDIVKLLVSKGADISAEFNKCNIPILISSQNQHLETCRWLIEEAAKTTTKKSALQIACQFGHRKIVEDMIFESKAI
jgi:ankyrin repeat protein